MFGIDQIAGHTVLVLKRRWRLFTTSLALLLVAFASLLYVNTPVAGHPPRAAPPRPAAVLGLAGSLLCGRWVRRVPTGASGVMVGAPLLRARPITEGNLRWSQEPGFRES